MPFQPDGKRPIYCKECLKTRRDIVEKGEIGGQPVKAEPATRGAGIEPISLHQAVKISDSERKKREVDTEGLRAALQEALRGKKEKTE